MTPAKLQEITISMFTVWHNAGTGYTPDTLQIPASFSPVNEPVQFEFQGKQYLITLTKKDMWKSLYRIVEKPADAPKRLISTSKFKALFAETVKIKGVTATDFARSLGFNSLADVSPLYYSTETAQYKYADLFAKAFGSDAFILKQIPQVITAPIPECSPTKGQKLFVCRAEFQRLTGYPHNTKTEIAYLLGFKSASAIEGLFHPSSKPYLTAYAQHLAEQLGRSVLWQPARKSA